MGRRTPSLRLFSWRTRTTTPTRTAVTNHTMGNEESSDAMIDAAGDMFEGVGLLMRAYRGSKEFYRWAQSHRSETHTVRVQEGVLCTFTVDGNGQLKSYQYHEG